MCGIAGIIRLKNDAPDISEKHITLMGKMIEHRGPDGKDIWIHEKKNVAFAHQRLSIIDLAVTANQPMTDRHGNWIVFNGEIYNYIELREELGVVNFVTNSDTEVILYAYRKWGKDCVNHLRGMFAFAIWDEQEQYLFCARDHFGIKPFYYAVANGSLYFASEIKAILPFLDDVKTDIEGLKDYLTFQLCLHGKTLFDNVKELQPAHWMTIKDGDIRVSQYWEIYYQPSFDYNAKYYTRELRERLEDSVKFHLRSDVPVGAYVSGGLDSSTIASIAADIQGGNSMMGFIGKFAKYGQQFDESRYAQEVADRKGFELKSIDITGHDFVEHIRKVIYHMDYPVAGPGSFSQYMVSGLASKSRKVVLGGQGGDEIFGGYTRYLVAYFEQCIKAAIDGTSSTGNFVVTYESIIPNLISLRNYKPMLKQFWKTGLFESMDRRYFQLVNRAPELNEEINWELLEPYSTRESFTKIFNGDNVGKESYFDLMTHFDFKTLLPALLQVEDRMSMAHGIESRVPLLDKSIIEMSAIIPSDIKFKDGEMKHIFKQVVQTYLPDSINNRKDKMGFPTPVNDWISNEANEFVMDVFTTTKARSRDFVNNDMVVKGLQSEGQYSRKIWGLLSLELWQQEFHDKSAYFKSLAQ